MEKRRPIDERNKIARSERYFLGSTGCQPVRLGSLPRCRAGLARNLSVLITIARCRQAACAPQIGGVNTDSEKLRSWGDVTAPIDWRPILARFFECQQFFPVRLCYVLLAQPLVFFARFFIELRFEFFFQ